MSKSVNSENAVASGLGGGSARKRGGAGGGAAAAGGVRSTALCAGADSSQNKPFCSGMHWYVEFHDPPPPDQPTIFEWDRLVPRVAADDTAVLRRSSGRPTMLLGPLFAHMSPEHPQRVAAWLRGGVAGREAIQQHLRQDMPRMLAQHFG